MQERFDRVQERYRAVEVSCKQGVRTREVARRRGAGIEQSAGEAKHLNLFMKIQR